MTDAELQDQIDKCKEHMAELDAAITSLLTGDQQSYSLNTGQTVTTVTKFNIAILFTRYEQLLNMCAMLEVRLNGGATINYVPGW